jgi:hypothetical protein
MPPEALGRLAADPEAAPHLLLAVFDAAGEVVADCVPGERLVIPARLSLIRRDLSRSGAGERFVTGKCLCIRLRSDHAGKCRISLTRILHEGGVAVYRVRRGVV